MISLQIQTPKNIKKIEKYYEQLYVNQFYNKDEKDKLHEITNYRKAQSTKEQIISIALSSKETEIVVKLSHKENSKPQ